MCGVAGTLSLGRPLDGRDVAAAEEMRRRLRHRGPDDHGTLHDGRAVLAVARLSILDRSINARQPFACDDDRVWLAYNGEVTNFRELRRRHDLDGERPLRSSGDTEVVLRLYRRLGLGMLDELTGMFAFCVYDRAAAKAYLVRDHFGQRPLFYTVLGERLHFASEIKAFYALDGFSPRPDRESVFHYFSLAYVPGSRTMFEGVRELGAGRLLEVDLRSGRIEERQYYEPRYRPEPMDEAQAAAQVRALLTDSLRRNLASDAGVGLAFSGGVDTSILLGLSRRLGRPLKTFSIRMDEPTFDESRYQRLMLGPGAEHVEVSVSARDVLENARAHMSFLDEPLGDGAAIPLFMLAREARKSVSVLISGEGGDEVFNAYETHRAYKARRLWRRAPEPVRRSVRWLAHRLPSSYAKLSLDFVCKRFTAGSELDVPSSHVYWRHALETADKSALLRGFRPETGTEDLFCGVFDRLPFPEELDRLSFLDLKYYLVDDLMLKNDRMLMAHSVEGRYPYLDRPLVEFAARIPTDLRLRGLSGARHIQKLAARDLLPPEIYRRSNMGLELPYSRWLLGPLRPFAERLFDADHVGRSGLLEPAVVRRLWEEHAARRRDNGRGLWSILMFELWFDLFVHDKSFAAQAAAA